jgi:hypothetical protein
MDPVLPPAIRCMGNLSFGGDPPMMPAVSVLDRIHARAGHPGKPQ